MSETQAGVLNDMLTLGQGLGEDDRPRVLELLASLSPHLARWSPEDIELRVAVKERGEKEQKVTLEADLPGLPPLVATATDRELERALIGARKELIRQLEDEKTKREPKNNRQLRKRTT
jgi:ribosome-associated translation inhibitor RaiA